MNLEKGVGINQWYKIKETRCGLSTSQYWIIYVIVTYHYHSWVQYKITLVKSTTSYPYFGFVLFAVST